MWRHPILFGFLMGFLALPAQGQETPTVRQKTGAAIQQAIDRAEPGQVIFLPAGDYATSQTIEVDKPVTLRGAGKLRDVGEIEWDGEPRDRALEGPVEPVQPHWGERPVLENDPPRWEGQVTRLHYGNDPDYDMFHVTANNVTFERLKVEGAIDETRENMATRQNGILVNAAHFKMTGCEMLRFPQALTFQQPGTRDNKVRDSYFHKNWHMGSAYGVRCTHAAEVDVRHCEFSNQRHATVASSAGSKMVVVDNYFVNDTRIQGAYSVDMHPHGYGEPASVMIVRDNVFRNTTGIVMHSGTGQITGNYFGPLVDEWNPTILVGPRSVHRDVTHAHDIYIGGNTNKTGESLLTMRTMNQDDGDAEGGAHNVYTNDQLFEAANTEHEAYRSNPRPYLGWAYLTKAGSTDRVKRIEPGQWYDLHAKAADPQGASNIARIGLQLHKVNRIDHDPLNEAGVFWPKGNYYVETDGEQLRARMSELKGYWNRIDTDADQTGWLNPSGRFAFASEGSHTIHFAVRFRLAPEATPGQWRIHGYVRDADGHLPHAKALYHQVGWQFEVRE